MYLYVRLTYLYLYQPPFEPLMIDYLIAKYLFRDSILKFKINNLYKDERKFYQHPFKF
jgi:hypothetical protein